MGSNLIKQGADLFGNGLLHPRHPGARDGINKPRRKSSNLFDTLLSASWSRQKNCIQTRFLYEAEGNRGFFHREISNQESVDSAGPSLFGQRGEAIGKERIVVAEENQGQSFVSGPQKPSATPS